MAEFDYAPNSHKYKSEQKETVKQKKVEKVVKGTVTTKKNDIRKFADIFISEDIHNVKDYVFTDILVPAIKKAISDIVRNGVDMILYGESGRDRKNSSSGNYVSYRSYSDQNNRDDRFSNKTRSTSYDDIVFGTREDARHVLSQMDALIETYGNVSISDLYDLVGISDSMYTNQRYGWTDIRRAEIVQVRGGWLLKLPRATVL